MLTIRRAMTGDEEGLLSLLQQVLLVHHYIRPDLFLRQGSKYTTSDFQQMFSNDEAPIFVAINDSGKIIGHCFTQIKTHGGPNLVSQKSLFIDDLCIDEDSRGQHVGKALYEYAVEYAKTQGCRRVTLHVWEGNDTAIQFYESMGMTPYMTAMEMEVL